MGSHAFEYLHYFGGQMTESDYPYTAQDGTCTADASKVAATVVSQVNITFMDEDQLHEAVGKYGPASVAYQVASDFRHYAGGVYSSTVCGSRPEDVNHAVLAVGYDHDEASGKDYWIVKNSGEHHLEWKMVISGWSVVPTCVESLTVLLSQFVEVQLLWHEEGPGPFINLAGCVAST